MAGTFYQNFTLKDIFNNKNLKNKLPLINYKEKELEDGRISVRTNAKTVNRQVFDTSISAARPFYKPLKPIRSGDTLILDGNLVGDHNEAVEAVYNALKAQRTILIWTANNADMIRTALKETETTRRKYGITPKLFLRAKSMQEIEGMSKQQIQALLSDIMENIFYGDDFPATQKKYKVEEIAINSPYNYKERKIRWKFKVGDF
jgi:hypothetical protein